MILRDVEALAEALWKAGIEFIVVGGASLERTWQFGTDDIDVAVMLKEYPKVLERLHDHPRFRHVEDHALPNAGSEFRVNSRWIDVEFISPKPFSGKLPPDRFFEYVRRHRSRTEGGIVFADPGVVWYMRLAISDWPTYVYKIARDVRAGVPPRLLDKVLDIARHFGNLDVTASRVEETWGILGLTRLDSPKSTKARATR